MADSLNPIINTVSRFCGEHAHILMISGIAVIVLVIIAAVAAGRRRRSKQDHAAEEKEGQKLDSGPAEPLEQQGSCTGPAQDEQPESYEKPAAKAPSITDGHGISGDFQGPERPHPAGDPPHPPGRGQDRRGDRLPL